MRNNRGLIATLFTIFIAVSFCLISPANASPFQSTSLTGLATLRQMAKQSTPYQVALANGKPTLLEFYADWCTTCQSMSPVINSLEQRYGDKINLVMLNIDNPQWQEVVEQYSVMGVPQFTFLDQEQQVVDTLVGKVPESIMAKIWQQLT